jgi:hypothetical protein
MFCFPNYIGFSIITIIVIIWFLGWFTADKKEGYDIYSIPDPKIPSFKKNIVILFRPYDIDSMKWKFDLSNYDQVRIYAEPIYKKLKSGMMPCDKPWDPLNIAMFKRWIDTGMKP